MPNVVDWNRCTEVFESTLSNTEGLSFQKRKRDFSYRELPDSMEQFMGDFSRNRRYGIRRQNKVFEKMGVTFNRVEYPWPRAYHIALNTPNTLIYSLTRTKDRELLFKWAGKVIDTNINVYSLNSRKDIVINSLKDLGDYTIGVMRDDITHKYLEKIGIQENLHVVSDERLNIKKLIADRVDLIVYDEYGFNHAINKLGYDQSSFRNVHTLTDISKSLYIAFSLKTDDELVEAFTKALDELKQEGLYENIFKDNL